MPTYLCCLFPSAGKQAEAHVALMFWDVSIMRTLVYVVLCVQSTDKGNLCVCNTTGIKVLFAHIYDAVAAYNDNQDEYKQYHFALCD
jgi:hypothetical protein